MLFYGQFKPHLSFKIVKIPKVGQPFYSSRKNDEKKEAKFNTSLGLVVVVGMARGG